MFLFAENGTSSETQFFYDGTKLIAEISPEHRFDFLYDENDRLYGFVLDKTATYFYVRDTLENVLGIVDSTGNLVVQYAYNAWGKNLGITGTLATTIGAYNPIRYKGYHFDSDTGMYYCHTRYYVPDWCRWLCVDNAMFLDVESINGCNLFAYCANSPINRIDASGTFDWRKLLTGLSIAFAVVIGVIATVSSGGILGAAVAGAAFGFATSATSNVIEQSKLKGWDNIDYGEVFKEGGIGAAIGAFSGIISFGFSKCVSNIGRQIGYTISKGVHIGSGVSFGKVFGTRFLMNVGSGVGYAVGTIAGAVTGDHIGSTVFNKESTMYNKMGNLVLNELPNLILDFIRWAL